METQEIKHLEEYLQLAKNAYIGISFSSDERGRSTINSHENELKTDLLKIKSDADKLSYIEGYKKHFVNWLSAKGRCISSMITGPSNFPVRRAEKANQSEHNRSIEFSNFRTYALGRIEKKELASRSVEEVNKDAFLQLSRKIRRSASVIFGIDNGTERGCSRPLFVSSITKSIETVAKNGNLELLKMCLKLIEELNNSDFATKPIVSSKHKIWGFLDIAEAAREQATDKQNAENDTLTFEGGEIVLNHSLNRIQIIYSEKPSREKIDQLKKSAFRWSPSNMAWQRHLNQAGKYAVQNVTGYKF